MNIHNKTTKKDMELINCILPFTTPENIPLSFKYDGKEYLGITKEMMTEESFRRSDSNFNTTIVKGRLDGLEITVEYIQYTDFAVTEWVAYFKNVSNEKTKILSDVRIAVGNLDFKDTELVYSNGDNLQNTGYEYFQNDLSVPFTLSPDESGTSCCGAAPYIRLKNAEKGVNIAVGWTGMWVADFEKTKSGTKVSFGQKRCHMYLNPGEIIRTPRINLQAYYGDDNHGRNSWRRFFFKHICPKDTDGQVISPKLCLHVFGAGGHPEFTGATEENQVKGLREYIRRGVKPDIWWFDAGWYPCNYDWPTTGTWEPNKDNWPNGLAPMGEECIKHGVKFLLWFEPERVRPGTWLSENHPEWMLKCDDVNYLLDYSNPEALKWTINHIDKLIKKFHVDIYRQDFNMNPMPHWKANETEDRIGAIENLHIQGYYKYWDELVRRNPGLLIDSCASGGRRNDLETMRRAIALQYTDIELGVHPTKQKQHRFMFEWIPYFRAHNMAWDNDEGGYFGNIIKHRNDEFKYHCAMAPALTDMLEWNDSDEEFELAKKMIPLWRRAAQLMISGDYYPLTECRRSSEDFYAMEFYSPENEKGFFQVVSNINVEEKDFIVKLTLDKNKNYKLENTNTDEISIVSGKELAEGIKYSLEKRSGVMVFFEAVQE